MKPGTGKELEVLESRETDSGGTLRDCWKCRPVLTMANHNVISFTKCYRSDHCVSLKKKPTLRNKAYKL